MSLSIILLLAVCNVLAALVTLSSIPKVGMRGLIKYSVLVDVLFTLGTIYIYSGTLGGTLVAVMSGLFMAITLKSCKVLLKQGTNAGLIKEPAPKVKSPRASANLKVNIGNPLRKKQAVAA